MSKRTKALKKRLSSPPHDDGNGAPIATLWAFRHGLGDLLQFSIVLRHLAKHCPGGTQDVVCGAGKELSYTQYERERFSFQDPRYDPVRYAQVIDVPWHDCSQDVDGLPSTKAYQFLTGVLKLPPEQELFRYELVVPDYVLAQAGEYLSTICGSSPDALGRYPCVVIHYQGCSSRMQKDLPTEVVAEVVNWLRSWGRTVAILDTGKSCPLVDQRTVFSPVPGHPVWQDRVNCDPQTVAALLELSEAHVGIDSGPTHVAGACSTQTVCVWTHHHPVRFYDFAPNVVHLLPPNASRGALGPNSLRTFRERYRSATYSNMAPAICEQLERILLKPIEGKPPRSQALPGLRAKGYTEDYYTEHLLAGLDYLGHGEWQRTYGLWLADVFSWRGKRVLDIGCACGSILRGLGEAGIVVQGIDVSEYLVTLGREKWPDMTELMHVADAVNLHLFDDAEWDGLHSNQVAEHWRPALVPHILTELRRVLKPGGLFFCVLDTTELFERSERTMDKEDPTHICVKPLDWWADQARATGWEWATARYVDALKDHAHSFLKRYDWDFFVLVKPSAAEE